MYVVLDSPTEYTRDFLGRFGDNGAWKGPPYAATRLASLGGNASLDWDIGFDRTARNAREHVVKNFVHGWAIVSEGSEPIEHRIGGRDAGTLAGVWLLTKGDLMSGEARYEAGLAFSLCGLMTLVRFDALTPASDSAGGAMGFGEYRVKGTVAPTVWNREQVLLSIQGVSVEGSLPPSRITARAAGRRISGTITDCNAHPVAIAIRLEKQTGRRWSRAGTGRTTAQGAFTLRASRPGTYRVVAGNRRSAAVRVR